MNRLTPRKLARCLAVWLAVTAGAAVLAWALLPLDATLAGTFDELLVRVSSWALLTCAVWFWFVTTVVIAAGLRARSASVASVPAVRGVPAPIRRLVLAACGLAITTGVAAPALATPGPVHVDPRDHSGRVVLTGLPFPDRATAGTPDAAAPHPARTSPHARHLHDAGDAVHVVVRHGDSLWSIAAAHLAPGADDLEVATAWHRIYDRNRDVIGDDPDLLAPGQHLVLPDRLR